MTRGYILRSEQAKHLARFLGQSSFATPTAGTGKVEESRNSKRQRTQLMRMLSQEALAVR